MKFEDDKYFCPECGWEGELHETNYDEELDLDLCPKCKNLLECFKKEKIKKG